MSLQPPVAPITREQKLVTAGVMAGIAVAALDATVVGTAMPTIIGQLGGIDQYGWVFAAYLLTATTTVPIWSNLADQHGRKPIFLIGLAIFVGGSVLCGLSQSMLQLIIFRAIQGLGAGAVQPIAFTIVGDIFEPRQRARMQGFFSSVWGISAIAGPFLGGVLTSTVGWRWAFFINVPVGLLAVTIIGLVLHERVERRTHRLDWAGVLTLTGGVSLLLLAVTEVADAGIGSPLVVASFAGAALLLWLFLRGATARADALIDLSLFRIPVVAAGLAIGTLAGIVMFGLTAYVPPLVQGVQGRSPLEAGLAVGAMSVGWPIAAIVAGRLLLVFGARPLMLAGTAMLVAGAALLTRAASFDGPLVAAAACGIVGCGLGFVSTTTVVTVQNAVDWGRRGQATGLIQFSRTIGGSVGVGVMGAILAAAVGPLASTVLDPIGRSGIAPAELAAAREGLVSGLGWIYLILLGTSVAALGLTVRAMPQAHVTDASRPTIGADA
ncbi:MAG: MDR family MFS transporter [Chloroflexota bacterium]